MRAWDFLVQTADKRHPTDRVFDWQQPKRGDVIDARPAGWPWSNGDLDGTRGVVTAFAADALVVSLCHREPVRNGLPFGFQRYRAIYLDLGLLSPAGVKVNGRLVTASLPTIESAVRVRPVERPPVR